MKVVTPGAVARHTGSKYLGVLVAAKYARNLNEFRRGEVLEDDLASGEFREKLTTTALATVARGDAAFTLTPRRKNEQ